MCVRLNEDKDMVEIRLTRKQIDVLEYCREKYIAQDCEGEVKITYPEMLQFYTPRNVKFILQKLVILGFFNQDWIFNMERYTQYRINKVRKRATFINQQNTQIPLKLE